MMATLILLPTVPQAGPSAVAKGIPHSLQNVLLVNQNDLRRGMVVTASQLITTLVRSTLVA